MDEEGLSAWTLGSCAWARSRTRARRANHVYRSGVGTEPRVHEVAHALDDARDVPDTSR
jgi:hypothetical protein